MGGLHKISLQTPKYEIHICHLELFATVDQAVSVDPGEPWGRITNCAAWQRYRLHKYLDDDTNYHVNDDDEDDDDDDDDWRRHLTAWMVQRGREGGYSRRSWKM